MATGHESSIKSVIFALGGNVVIALIKYIVAFITFSTAMLAEAIHSSADCMNQVFLLIGNKRSQKAANEIHSFGFGKEEYFWGFLVAVLLFFAGATISIYEGIKKAINPGELHNVYWAIGVLFISIVIETKSFHVAYKAFSGIRFEKSFLKALRCCTDTSLLVILMEDLAALTGLVIVMVSTILAWLVNPVFDAIGSIFVGLLLAYVSFFLTTELKKLLIGESIDKRKQSEIMEIIKSSPVVKKLVRFQTMMLGSKRFLVLASVDVDDSCTGREIEDRFQRIKADIIKKFSGAEIIYIEAQE